MKTSGLPEQIPSFMLNKKAGVEKRRATKVPEIESLPFQASVCDEQLGLRVSQYVVLWRPADLRESSEYETVF